MTRVARAVHIAFSGEGKGYEIHKESGGFMINLFEHDGDCSNVKYYGEIFANDGRLVSLDDGLVRRLEEEMEKLSVKSI